MDIKVNADLNQAIEQIAEKLGIATKEIIPHYTKWIFAEAKARTIENVIGLLLPFLLFLIPADTWETYGIFLGVRLLFVVIMTYNQISAIASWYDNLKAPEAAAIDKLINQLT